MSGAKGKGPLRPDGYFAALGRAALAVILACALGSGAGAHEVPVDVRLNMFVKPVGNRLELLVRVPLAAMGDVDVPVRGPGYLDVSRADAALRDAAKMWLVDHIDVFENDRRLQGLIAQARVSLPSDLSFASY